MQRKISSESGFSRFLVHADVNSTRLNFEIVGKPTLGSFRSVVPLVLRRWSGIARRAGWGGYASNWTGRESGPQPDSYSRAVGNARIPYDRRLFEGVSEARVGY